MIDKATSRSTLQSLSSILELQANIVFDKTQKVGVPHSYLEKIFLCKIKIKIIAV